MKNFKKEKNKRLIEMQNLLAYEMVNGLLMSIFGIIKNKKVQNLLAKYYAKKVKRKYRKYELVKIRQKEQN